MSVSYGTLLVELAGYSISTKTCNPSAKLEQVQLYENGCKYDRYNVLVICDGVAEAAHAMSQAARNILCFDKDAIETSKEINLVTVHEIERKSEVINKTLALFLSSGNSDEYLMLMRALTFDSGLNRMMSESRRLVHNPIVLVNANMELIAQNISDSDSACDEIADFCARAKKDAPFMSRIVSAHRPQFIEWPNQPVGSLGQKAICNRLIINGELYGFVFVLEHLTPLSAKDFESVELISYILSYSLKVNSRIENRNAGEIQRIIRILLTNSEISDFTRTENRLKLLGGCLASEMRVGVFETKNDEESSFRRAYAERELSALIKDANFVNVNENVVMLASEKSYKRHCEELRAYLEDSGQHMGLSTVFNNISKIRECYFQAHDALRMGLHLHAAKNEYKYEEFNAYYPFFAFSKHHSVESLIKPCVKAIAEYDAQHSSDLLKTLYVVYESMFDSSYSAKALNIHRNTLYKRLEKINSIAGENITSPGFDIGSVYYSIKAYEFINRVWFKNEFFL